MEETPKQVLYTEKDFPSFCTWKSVRTTQSFAITDRDLQIGDMAKGGKAYPHEWFTGIEIIHSYHKGEKFFALKFHFHSKHAPSFFTRTLTLGDFSYDDVVRLHSIYSMQLELVKQKNAAHGAK